MFTVGTYNLQRTDSIAEIADGLRDVLMSNVDVLVINEHEQRNAKTALELVMHEYRKQWGAWIPAGPGGAVCILWRKGRAKPVTRGTSRLTHEGLRDVSPDRFINRRAFEIDGIELVVLAHHAVNNFSKNTLGNQAYRDRGAARHYRIARRMTRRLQRRNPLRRNARKRVIVMAGDFNATLRDEREPWYPGPVLDGLYHFDRLDGIDHIIINRASGATFGKRRTMRTFSDHPFVAQDINPGR